MTLQVRSRPAPNLLKTAKVFDFFCGCGGASAGFRAAGLEIAFGLDNDSDAAQTFQSNFTGAEFILADIEQVSEDAIDGLVDAWADHPLLFNACAPCQPFSKQRRGVADPDDTRLQLLYHLLRFVYRHRPELIFAENVPGLRDGSAGKDLFQRFTQALSELGYRVSHGVIRSQDYGVPQRRGRLVLMASLLGSIAHPKETHGPDSPSPKYSTVADWIGSLPAIAAGETHPTMPSHRAARLSPLNLERIRATPPGGGWRDLPPHLQPNSRRSGFKGYTDVYGRLRWNAPAPALTTRCISYSNGRFGHPQQDRALSIREAAALQTFPIEFTFTGNLNSQAKQIGNAVPALLAQRFGESIIAHLKQLSQNDY
ncbi:DNA cytosine methyltransferase [Candidatus Poriferisodalis sp.]|uniref:DNA cytosine methyltransferase n=1 Tax=Candidatus Poriferisodalis sp. TaxID=3101277 RepID=UPI003C6FFF1E